MIVKIGLVLLVLGAIAWREVVTSREKASKRERWAYLGLMGVAAVIGALLVADVELPSPSRPLSEVFAPINAWVFS